MATDDNRRQVLVFCTGNSCRSIMAEALINHLGQERYKAASAGSAPAGHVHPKSVATLERHGIDTAGLRSKSWDEFADRHFDIVITVCDQAANESCPLYTGGSVKLHWSTPDPASAEGDDQTVDAAFEAVFALLRNRIEEELL